MPVSGSTRTVRPREPPVADAWTRMRAAASWALTAASLRAPTSIEPPIAANIARAADEHGLEHRATGAQGA